MARQEEVQIAAKATQREPAATDLAIKRMTTLRGRDTVAAFSRAAAWRTSSTARTRPTKTSRSSAWASSSRPKKPCSASGSTPPIAWTADVGMQVVVEGHEALVYTGDKRAQADLYHRSQPASRAAALQSRRQVRRQAGRRRHVHDPLRQRRRLADGQRHDRR